jgi:hypothetical protein
LRIKKFHEAVSKRHGVKYESTKKFRSQLYDAISQLHLTSDESTVTCPVFVMISKIYEAGNESA